MPGSSPLQQLIDELYQELKDPNSSWYAPNLVLSNHYDPYTGIPYNPSSKGVNWDFGQMTDPDFVTNAASICPTIAIESGNDCVGYKAAPAPPHYPTLSLTDVVITGLSNVTVQPPVLGDDGVTLTTTVDFSQPSAGSNYPKVVTLAGNFSLTIFCCCPPASNPRAPCESGATIDTRTGSGTFSATIPASSATLTCTINNVNNPGVIPTLTANKFVMTVPNKPDNSGPNMSITIDITSVPPNEQQGWNNQATKVFNNPQALAAILNQLNTQLNQSGDLQTLGDILTQQLDDYLRAHGLYPYPASFAHAF